MTKKLPYADIEILVYAYQEGSKDAIETLLEHYEGYFFKFLDVLKPSYYVYKEGRRAVRYAKFDIYNSIQRRFATAFMKTKYDRDSVQFFRKNPAIKGKVYRSVARIRHLFQNHDGEDLLQLMRVIFMDMANAHRGTKFYNYISTTFPKILLNHLFKMVHDIKEEPFVEELVAEYGYVHEDEYQMDKPPLKYRVNSFEHTVYDINWINGECEEIFDHLTPLERRILKLYYEEKTFFPEDFADKAVYEERRQRHKCSDTDIADKLGCSRKTVNQKRNLIVASIYERALENQLVRSDSHAGTQ